jgi:pimeloyl-ACP methyl ester carboxylesterase
MVRIGVGDGGVVLVRSDAEGGPDSVLVDEPARMRFRQRVDAGQVAALSLAEVVEPEPGRLDAWSGWYAGHDRRVLLIHIPEEDFGEPMVLAGEGEELLRAYPLGADRFLRADGLALSLVEGPDGGPGVRLGEDGSAVLLGRDDRYRERAVEFGVDGDVLAGTLITPAGAGPHPALVVVHGASGGQRDFCRLFLEPVLDTGVAVLVYDRRGRGSSTGTTEVTIFDQARAAGAGLDRIAGEADIDAGRLGLLGFSNGMWSVPMVAADRADVTFVVGIGSPGVSMAEAEVHRRTKVLREAGVGPATVRAAGQAWQCIFAVAAAGHADDRVVTELSEALGQLGAAEDLDRYEIPPYARQNPLVSAVPPMAPVDELVRMVSGQPDPELGHDPATDYARVRCPVLLQWGTEDTSVPVEPSVQRISAALAGSRSATLRVYPDTEHMLNAIPTGLDGISVEEAMYGFHGFRFAAGVRADLRDWLRATLP